MRTKEEVRDYAAAYYSAHKEEILTSKAAHYSEHREEKAIYYADVIKPQGDDRRAFLDKAKSGVGCVDCGSTNMLDFHHGDKSSKKYSIADMLWKPWCDIMDEIFKCVVLCRSCHKKRHAKERTQWTSLRTEEHRLRSGSACTPIITMTAAARVMAIRSA